MMSHRFDLFARFFFQKRDGVGREHVTERSRSICQIVDAAC